MRHRSDESSGCRRHFCSARHVFRRAAAPAPRLCFRRRPSARASSQPACHASLFMCLSTRSCRQANRRCKFLAATSAISSPFLASPTDPTPCARRSRSSVAASFGIGRQDTVSVNAVRFDSPRDSPNIPTKILVHLQLAFVFVHRTPPSKDLTCSAKRT